ncbi:MAG: hypothetical protein IPO08_19320 [Xanthomonadales bacterium]|jgi:hypothetical protein|nr:hypothetical protein [Xanthomonadales bacterium]
MEDMAERMEFRQSGRRVLRNRSDPDAHEARVQFACRLRGTEPLQGALADMAHAAAGDPSRLTRLLPLPDIRQRLLPGVLDAFARQISSGPLPRVTALATRYSILAMPSLDVPARAILCGADDSRRAAAEALPALLNGNAAVEEAFLAHCEGAGDTLAFMLARSAMIKARRELSPRWREVSETLQRGPGS